MFPRLDVVRVQSARRPAFDALVPVTLTNSDAPLLRLVSRALTLLLLIRPTLPKRMSWPGALALLGDGHALPNLLRPMLACVLIARPSLDAMHAQPSCHDTRARANLARDLRRCLLLVHILRPEPLGVTQLLVTLRPLLSRLNAELMQPACDGAMTDTNFRRDLARCLSFLDVKSS